MSSSRDRIRAFIRLGRPKFLLNSFLVFGLGTVIAIYEGVAIDLGRYVMGQCFVWCVHLMTHYCNEYFDLEADLANRAPTGWTGGSRILVAGILAPSVALSASFVLAFVAIALAVAMPTESARWIAFAALALAWFYTAPPLRFNYRGLGELVVATVINGLFPALAYALQQERVSMLWIAVLAPTALIQGFRMMVMNLSDYAGDKASGKRTLVVIVGPERAAIAVAIGQLVAYGTAIGFWLAGVLPRAVCAAMLLTVPLSLWLSRHLVAYAREGRRLPAPVPFGASIQVATMVLTALGALAIEVIRARPLASDATGILAIAIPALCVIGMTRQIQVGLR